jgi:hypothetical protein
MKSLYFFYLLILSSLAQAQQPWEKFEDMDSTSFVETFGTLPQYHYQKSIEDRSSHKTLCLWTGAKPIWLYNFAMYLNLRDYEVVWDADSENRIEIEATPKIYTTDKAPLIKLTANINSKGQVLSASITGPPDDVISIFLDYWELTGISINELKSKKAFNKDFVSDRVSFSWMGVEPVIKVAKNPDAGMDFFKIN